MPDILLCLRCYHFFISMNQVPLPHIHQEVLLILMVELQTNQDRQPVIIMVIAVGSQIKAGKQPAITIKRQAELQMQADQLLDMLIETKNQSMQNNSLQSRMTLLKSHISAIFLHNKMKYIDIYKHF